MQQILVALATKVKHSYVMNKPTSPNQRLTLDRFAPYRLSILSNQVSTAIATAYRDRFALSVTEWRIMAVLGEMPGVSGEDVSQKTHIEKSMLSRAIQKLLNRHLVQRSVDPNDRRKHVLTLSALGEEIYQQIVPLSLTYEKKLLSCFNTQEQQIFSDLVDRLLNHATVLANTP